MKILVIGASGFVGGYLLEHFHGIGTSTTGANGFKKLDLTVPQEIVDVMRSVEPDVVINSSGITNVDLCEIHPDLAMTVNGTSLGGVASECRRTGAKLIHISTDYVFDGERGNYKESDQTDPVNRYGASKLLGEKLVADGQYSILRISTPYGPNLNRNKETFFEFVSKRLGVAEHVRAATDLYTTPTFVGDISAAVEVMIKEHLNGMFHLGGSRRLSRYEFSQMIAKSQGTDPELVVPCLSTDLPFRAKRPHDTSLDSSKIRRYLDLSQIEKSLHYTISFE